MSGPICERADERLLAYADGEAGLEARAEIEAHLGACAACQAEVAALRAESAHLRAACRREAARAGGFDLGSARLARAIEARVGHGGAGGGAWRLVRRLLTVAAALLIATLGIGLLPGPAAADFVRDHCTCGCAMAAGWTTGDAALRTLLDTTTRGMGVFPCLEAAGFRPIRGHVCRVDGIDFVHVIYGAPGRACASVYVGERMGGLDGRFLPTERCERNDGLEVVHLRCPGGVHYVVVADAKTAEALRALVRRQIGR